MTLDERFLNLLQRYVSNLTIRGRRAIELRPFHPDRPGGDTARMQSLNSAYEKLTK